MREWDGQVGGWIARENIERDILIEGASCGVREKLGTREVSRKTQR